MTSVPTPSPAITAIVKVFIGPNTIVAGTILGSDDTGLPARAAWQNRLACLPDWSFGTYRPGRETVFKALDEGLNYFLFFGFDNHLPLVLRETLPPRADP